MDETALRVRGEIDLSAVDVDPEVPLRVAAVRDGAILTSDTLDLPKSTKKPIPYELSVVLPADCWFWIYVGRADVSDAIFLRAELASAPVRSMMMASDVEVKAEKRSAAKALSLTAPLMAIEASHYLTWLGWCKKYRVTGRIVCRHWRWTGHGFAFCDDPVPGATIELSDVDCFWWFCRTDLITTATSQADGTFSAEFWWCCAPWRPWAIGPWAIEPELLRPIRELIEQADFPSLPLPQPDPKSLQPFIEELGAHLADPVQPGGTRLSLDEMGIAERLPSKQLEALHVWPWWSGADCAPDLRIRATQECHGEVEVVYEESLSQTRWNIGTNVNVTLLANSKACCISKCNDELCGDCIKVGNVGCVPVMTIGGNDPNAAVPAALHGVASPGSADILFARDIGIDAVWGSGAAIDYYEIEYSLNGSPFAPLPADTVAGFQRIYWGPECGVPGSPKFNPVSFPAVDKFDAANVSHRVIRTRRDFEQACDPASWENMWFPGGGRWWTTNRDYLFTWHTAATSGSAETPLLADGLYTLRVVGWAVDGAGKLVDRQLMRRCDTNEVERLLIRLDNRLVPNHAASIPSHPHGAGFTHIPTIDPDCDIVSMVKNEGGKGERVVNPCDIVRLRDTDSLTVHFTATVPAGVNDEHLGGYSMGVHYAESAFFDALAASGGPQSDPTVIVGPTYSQAVAQGAVRPQWGGGSYKVVLPGSAFPETCAYLFNLAAWKRVNNGCGSVEYFHRNETEYSITIEKH
ncbi:MAG: hypothetical protein HKN07_11625 [Acidimicrobiia bacterium]|nr:hypothetical protein [Acidimicrobiia bacterium]